MHHMVRGRWHARYGPGVAPDGEYVWHARVSLGPLEGLPGGAEVLESLLIPGYPPTCEPQHLAAVLRCMRDVLKQAKGYGVDLDTVGGLPLGGWKTT